METNLSQLYEAKFDEQINLLLHFHEGNQKNAINSLLDTLVEGHFHIERNATIRSPSHINVLLFGLLPRLDPALQPELVDTFAHIVYRHLRNAETCRTANVTQNLVTLLSTMTVSPELRTSFVNLLQAIGSHSTSINDVYVLFRPIVALHRNRKDDGDPEVALLLLRGMTAMTTQRSNEHQHQEGKSFFDLDPAAVSNTKFHQPSPSSPSGGGGRRATATTGWSRPTRSTGILVPASSVQAWPTSGYTIILSIRPEILDPNASHELFTFRGSQGHGISCRVVSASLVFTVYTTPVNNRTEASSDDIGTGKDYVVDNVFAMDGGGEGEGEGEGEGDDGREGGGEGGESGVENGSRNTHNRHTPSKKRRSNKRARFTTICINHVQKTLWRSRVTVHINGVQRGSKRLVSPPASNMSPVTDGYFGS